VSFPGVTACLAPCRGLPINLLSPCSSPCGGPAEPPADSSCYCCVLLLKAMTCLSPAHSTGLQGSLKAMSSPRDVAVAPDVAPNYPRGVFPGLLEVGVAILFTTERTSNLGGGLSPSHASQRHPALEVPIQDHLLPGRRGRSGDLFPQVLQKIFSESKKKKKGGKKSQGLAKVSPRYQPLQASLSGVWEASQAELCTQWSR